MSQGMRGLDTQLTLLTTNLRGPKHLGHLILKCWEQMPGPNKISTKGTIASGSGKRYSISNLFPKQFGNMHAKVTIPTLLFC